MNLFGLLQTAICVFVLTGCAVLALKNVSVNVPEAVPRGDDAILKCNFDLEGDALYSVKWYFGSREFYRYTPKETPSVKIFQLKGLKDHIFNVDRETSNATQLSLKHVMTSLSGHYSCEVSADAPSFHTLMRSGNMTVVVTPRSRPYLTGIKPRYAIGETLKANCTSAGSRPAANLTWLLNDQPVNTKHVLQYREVLKDDLETSSTLLTLPLMNFHFTQHGRLKVRCAASIYSIYWQSTEKSAEEDRPRGTLVNDVGETVRHHTDEDDEDYNKAEIFPPTSESSSSDRSEGTKTTALSRYYTFYGLVIVAIISVKYVFVIV